MRNSGIQLQTLADKRAMWLCLIVPVLLLFVGTLLIDFNGLYGQDSHTYLLFAKQVKAEWLTGNKAASFFWPKGYSVSGAALSFTGLSVLWSLRIVSLLALTGSLFVARSIIRLLWNKEGSSFLLLGAATQIYFVRAGFLVMSDMLTAFLILTMIYAYLRFLKDSSARWLLAVFFFATLAFFTRYACVPLLLIPVGHTVIYWLKKQTVLVRISALAVILALATIFIYWNNNLLIESAYRLGNWSLGHFFAMEFVSRDGAATNTVPNALYIFGNFLHLGFLSIGLLLLPFYRSLDRKSLHLLLIAGIYLLFLGGIETQNYRFLVVTHLIVLIALFPAFDSCFTWLKKRKLSVLLVIGVLLFNGAFGVYSFRKTLAAHRLEKEVVMAVKAEAKHETIYSFYVDQSFPSYGINNRVRNFFMADYDTFEKGALVVFNETQFRDQWKNHRVMRNWNSLKEQHDLDTLQRLTDNWNIYRIR
ncbi:MAG: glycosyltransferase family 39 protein [Bacteroidota bacterium]